MTSILTDIGIHDDDDCRGSNLDRAPALCYAPQNLQNIYLTSSEITELPSDFFKHFTHLRWLDLRNNKLKTLPTTVQNHRSLETLLLDDNQLFALPLELGSVSTLKGLQVTNNPLVYPPGSIVEKGVQHLIRFLQDEWKNRDQQKSTKFDITEPSGRSNIYLEDVYTNRREVDLHLQLKKSDTINSRKSCSRKFKNKVKTPLLAIENYVRVKKLLKSKPQTTLNLFEFWDQLTPSHLMEKLSYSQLAKYEKKDDSQSSFRPLATPRDIQQANTFKVPYKMRHKTKLRSFPRKLIVDKLRNKDDFERDIQQRRLESLQRLQQKITLERQERILQRGKTKEALKHWRLKTNKQPRRDSRSQMRKILRHDQDSARNQTIGGRSSGEDFLRKLDLIREKFQELTIERSQANVTLEIEQKLTEQNMRKILSIQRNLKELKRGLQ